MLAFETGHFAMLWQAMASSLGLEVDLVPGDWRHGVDPDVVEERLTADTGHEIKAVCVVHNETSTGVTSRVAEVREAIDRAGHPALLLVDTISSLGSIDYRHDEWGVDVTVSGSQKGLMLPPGLGFNAVSEKALAASRSARLPGSYWDWEPIIAANQRGFWPYTPATNLLYGLRVALQMLDEEGLPQVFARHQRHAEATRAAVRGLGSGDPVRRRARALRRADRDPAARRARRRRGTPRHPRALRHVARRRAWARLPGRCSGSATSATSTT